MTNFRPPRIRAAGYGAVWHGQKSWNGVAILARGAEPVETRRGLPGDPDDMHSRYIEAAIDGLIVGCLYLPNVRVKISGACTMSHQPFPYDDIWDPVLRVIDAFGLDRCMWGTDWTRTIGMLTYEQGVAPFRDTNVCPRTTRQRSWEERCRKSTSGSGTVPIRPRHNLTE